jgi:hypothetical protein
LIIKTILGDISISASAEKEKGKRKDGMVGNERAEKGKRKKERWNDGMME